MRSVSDPGDLSHHIQLKFLFVHYESDSVVGTVFWCRLSLYFSRAKGVHFEHDFVLQPEEVQEKLATGSQNLLWTDQYQPQNSQEVCDNSLFVIQKENMGAVHWSDSE